MSATAIDKTKYDGKWLVFERATERLSFKSKAQDTETHLTVGMVWGGAVAGRPVSYWLQRISKDSKDPKKEA